MNFPVFVIRPIHFYMRTFSFHPLLAFLEICISASLKQDEKVRVNSQAYICETVKSGELSIFKEFN